MKILKRNGRSEEVNLNKITSRLKNLLFIKGVDKVPLSIDITEIAKKVVLGLYDGVTSVELDSLASETAAAMGSINPEFDKLAARLEITALHKETLNNYSSKYIRLLNLNVIQDRGVYISELVNCNSIIDYNRDFLLDYFGIKTLKKSYLLKDKKGKIIERPQDMWMRVASFLHSGDLDAIKETYDLMSKKYFTHATPTLFNAGTIKPQLSSCFLLDMHDDSIEGIYKTITDCAKISQSAGGIGLSTQKVRSKGSYIHGTNGTSNGIVPMLRVFDSTARYVDQGGGKRKGSIAVYLEPWHADVLEFLDLKKNHGKEEMRARDLFYAMWIPDLFMQRVEDDGIWTLFDPKTVSKDINTLFDSKGNVIKDYSLSELYGKDFTNAYIGIENSLESPKFKGTYKQIKARELWNKIIESQIETGTPYMLYKDAINEKCNQKNLGTIKSSNLCTEITEYTSPDEVAVCNLASIGLPMFVNESEGTIDYDELYNVSSIITRNLNKVIDKTHYPLPEAKYSNLKHRPIGIGVQGLADVFAMLKLPFSSDEAKQINSKIFETIYKGAVDASIELAKEFGPYESYEGSPTSEGKLQFDLWDKKPNLSYDWFYTYENLKKYGIRNSLLIAPMPTASTSQILGNNEAFEPFTSNIYTRRTLSGEFVVVNKHLVKELTKLKLWNVELKDRIILENGSIQDINSIPSELKERYKTVWEMSMKDIIDMAADRARFVCQSQSMNLFVADPTLNKITSMHFYAWKKGLKTGMYYLRTKAASKAIQFTITEPKDKVLQEASEFECVNCGS